MDATRTRSNLRSAFLQEPGVRLAAMAWVVLGLMPEIQGFLYGKGFDLFRSAAYLPVAVFLGLSASLVFSTGSELTARRSRGRRLCVCFGLMFWLIFAWNPEVARYEDGQGFRFWWMAGSAVVFGLLAFIGWRFAGSTETQG